MRGRACKGTRSSPVSPTAAHWASSRRQASAVSAPPEETNRTPSVESGLVRDDGEDAEEEEEEELPPPLTRLHTGVRTFMTPTSSLSHRPGFQRCMAGAAAKASLDRRRSAVGSLPRRFGAADRRQDLSKSQRHSR